MGQHIFEFAVIVFYFALLALPVVGILVGFKYFPPEDTPLASDTEPPELKTSDS